jgi:hypothetical protein
MASGTANLIVLHLSDAHIRDRKEFWVARAAKISAAIRSHVVTADALLICFTGDITYGGQLGEFELAKAFIAELKTAIAKYHSGQLHVILTPGNHDCDLSQDQLVRSLVIEKLRAITTGEFPDELVAECAKVLSAYEAFRAEVETLTPTLDGRLCKQYEIRVGERIVSIQTVNTAWSCERKLQPSSIPFPLGSPWTLCNPEASIRLALTHLPYNWMKQEIYRDFRRRLRQDADVVLTGHEHEVNPGYLVDAEGGETAFIEGGALLAHGSKEESSFALARVAVDSKSIDFYPFVWKTDAYIARPGSGATTTIVLKQSRSRRLGLSQDGDAYFHDLGASLTHPAVAKVTLPDLFVYPELQTSPNGDGEAAGSLVFDSSKLISKQNLDPTHALVRGDHTAGKTTLLKALFLDALDAGLVPIFINGRDLSRSSALELQKLLDKSVREHYDSHSAELAIQADKEKRVLFIDNIDRYTFPPQNFPSVIEFFEKSCVQIVATADSLFDLQELLLADSMTALRGFDQYQLLTMGVSKRAELVRRWCSVGADSGAEMSTRPGRSPEPVSKLISDVLAKGLVPKYPLYVLILLQGVEAGQANVLEDSALGQYYEYLILHKLQESINQDSLKEVLNYCEHFSWYVYQRQRDRVSDADLRKFHSEFETSHAVEIRFHQRKQSLVDTTIWVEADDEVRFRYPYTYFFFLGRYLARHFNEPEIRALARTFAAALHVRENGNALLFMAHHSKHEDVLEMIVESVGQRFSGLSPISFDGDMVALDRLVDQVPQLVYEHTQIEAKRTKIIEGDELVTENLDRAQGVAEEADSNAASLEAVKLIAELNALFKGMEILGMALKADYGDLKAERKLLYLKCIFDAGLRGLRKFSDIFAVSPEAMIQFVQEKLLGQQVSLDERSLNLAKREIFRLLVTTSMLFFRKIGGSVGSGNLHPAIRQLLAQDVSSAYRLAEVAAFLETPGPIPIERLRSLNSDFSSRPLAAAILGRLALTRVYMYETSQVEKQQLFSTLGIRVERQQAIDVRTTRTKKARLSRKKSRRRNR